MISAYRSHPGITSCRKAAMALAGSTLLFGRRHMQPSLPLARRTDTNDAVAANPQR